MKLKLFDAHDCDKATKYIFDLKEKGLLKHEKPHRFGPDNHHSYKTYKDEVFKELSLKALPLLEEGYGLELYPTYTYTRLYVEGFILKPHRDRPACEYSSTVTISYGDRETPWEIYVENEDGDGVEYNLESGEGLLYEGRKYHHWRMPLDKGWQIQTFVHYIKVGGEVYNQVLEHYPDFDFTTPFNDFHIPGLG